jgi:type I restriction enzyme, S subunit
MSGLRVDGNVQRGRGPKTSTWRTSSVLEVADFTNGRPHEADISPDGTANLITLDSVDIMGNLKKRHKQVNCGDGSLKSHDLVTVLSDLAHGNLLGLTAEIPKTGTYVLNQRMGRLRVREPNVAAYVRLQINAAQSHFKNSGQGTSQRHIYERDFRNLFIPMPLPDEQRGIASAIGDAEKLIAALERLIVKKQAIKRGMIHQLLSGEIRLPGFTSSWTSGPLKLFMPLQRGFDLPTSKVIPGKYPVVYSNGIGRTHAVAMAKGPGVITGRSGTIGKVHYVEKNYWPHNTALWVTSFARSDAKFVYYFLTHIGLQRFSSGSGVPTLNRNDAHGFQIRLPSDLDEQRAIATALTDMDNEIDLLRARLVKARAVKQGMMQQLLPGRTRLAFLETDL